MRHYSSSLGYPNEEGGSINQEQKAVLPTRGQAPTSYSGHLKEWWIKKRRDMMG